MAVFNNPDVVAQGWYAAALSRDLRPGKVLSCELGRERLALFRGPDGTPRALDARCAHLGADLGSGDLAEGLLRCPFHHWAYDGEGHCAARPGAAVFAYPTEERYGAVWVFNGPKPLFPVPGFEGFPPERLDAVALKPQRISCHPHLIAPNGLDVSHFRALHGFEFDGEPALDDSDPFRVRLRMRILLRGRNAFEGALRLVAGPVLTAAFTTWGGNLATIEGRAGSVDVLVLFSHRPVPGGGSESRTFLLLPRAPGWRGALGLHRLSLAVAGPLMAYILTGDRELLDRLRFRPNLVESDAGLAAFMRQVERLPVFSPG